MPNTLEATVDISASPEQVWQVLSDLKRMPEFSPTTKRMIPLGTPAAGTWTININRVEGKYVYPTTSRIVRYEPNREFAFRMNENGVVWSYTLEPIETGTKLVERRDIPNGVRRPVRMLINAFLGGEQQFEAELVRGMNETLERIKATAER
ncbi:SRPBCC family protein [Nocardia sp. alder85J]|uniref:SRPBCC family protein n=1 Tax=Nocardia sp. alder85J TaxID=2862949 RepID=UPI001CD78697|nr:SRPBCC family protein [Nocardia sp. alder85J]MCX4098999.1 SRPBCC family protein [Nocardia sp. alder85J]